MTPQPTMTGDAAVSAMLRGEKVTHRYFEKGEWVRMENGKVIFEDGATEYLDNFWAVRKSEAWQTDWSIFTPIVPSPDSVRDMGEVTKHTPGEWVIGVGRRNGFEDLYIVSLQKSGHRDIVCLSCRTQKDAELIAAAPATAARLEEVTRENEELKKRILFFEGSGYLNYQKLVEQRDSLLKDVERYREALNRFKEFVVRAGASVDLEERKKLMDLFAALSRGATEQSTEQ